MVVVLKQNEVLVLQFVVLVTSLEIFKFSDCKLISQKILSSTVITVEVLQALRAFFLTFTLHFHDVLRVFLHKV